MDGWIEEEKSSIDPSTCKYPDDVSCVPSDAMVNKVWSGGGRKGEDFL
jgi:hypothetical protein